MASNQSESMQQSDQNVNITHQRMQQMSKNISLHSEMSMQDSINENNADNKVYDEENNQIILFPKNNVKNQQQNNPLESVEPKTQDIALLYPWLNNKTLAIQNPLIKLHNQVIDYFLMYQEEQQTNNHVLYFFNKLQGILFKAFKNCDVLAPFLTHRVYLKNSEVEIFILFDQSTLKSPQTIQKVRQCLQKSNFQQIRFFEAPSQEGRQHKIGFNCITPQKNYAVQVKIVTSEWISYLSMINDALQNNLESKFLYLIFDTMVRQRGMQNSVKGYFIFGLVAVFLSERRRQKSRSLTENILKFLQYFGIGPFTERKITFIEKNEFEITVDSQQNNGMSQFSFWIGPNVDISSHMSREFFSILRNRYRLINNLNFSNSPSVLAALLNPGTQPFRY